MGGKSLYLWWICMLGLAQKCQSYMVTVNTLPNGPIAVGSSVVLTCAVNPVPPGPLSYSYYSSFNYISSQGPNASVYIGTDHPKQGYYFCHVLSNGTKVAIGYTVLKPQGFLMPIGPTEVSYKYGDTIVLQVNISSNYYAAQQIQSLQWYKDGSPLSVNCSSDTRVYTDTMGTRLTIMRAGQPDEGQYTVKIQSVQGVNKSYECIQNMLSVMECYYALHSPVTFAVSLSSLKDGTEQPTDEQHMYLNTTANEIEKAVNIGQFEFQSCIYFCLYCYYYEYSQIYFNGIEIYDSRVTYTWLNGTLIINISNATLSSLGVYEIELYLCGGFFPIWFSCLPVYFLYSLQFSGIQINQAFIVQEYVPPQVKLQALPTHLNMSSSINVITCAALNGTPDSHNITLIKNGSVLETVIGGNTLTYIVTWSGLGKYICRVDSLYSIHQESIVLRKSAISMIQLISNENLPYLCQNEPTHVHNMTTQLRHLTETLCSCTLSNDTFTQPYVTCSSNNEPWHASLTVVVQYASDDGSVTSSDLISMIHNWMLNSTCGCIGIESSSFKLSRGCCTAYNSNLQDTLFSSDNKLIAGSIGFIAGVLLTIFLGASIIFSIAKVRKSYDSREATDQSKNGGHRSIELEMKDERHMGMEENIAYDTVKYE